MFRIRLMSKYLEVCTKSKLLYIVNTACQLSHFDFDVFSSIFILVFMDFQEIILPISDSHIYGNGSKYGGEINLNYMIRRNL